MRIYVNNKPEDFEEGLTLSGLLEKKGIKENGTAISVNDQLVCHGCWDERQLADGDRLIIISAAFGG